jgi:hypothetical protein
VVSIFLYGLRTDLRQSQIASCLQLVAAKSISSADCMVQLMPKWHGYRRSDLVAIAVRGAVCVATTLSGSLQQWVKFVSHLGQPGKSRWCAVAHQVIDWASVRTDWSKVRPAVLQPLSRLFGFERSKRDIERIDFHTSSPGTHHWRAQYKFIVDRSAV